MRLVLVRHGESVWNEVRRFQGTTDVALSERGRAQARALSGALRPFRPAVAYVSPLARARETGEIALAGTGVRIVPVPELREFSLGEWEGCLSDEIRTRTGDPYGAWVRAPLDCPPPGSEPLDAVQGRVLAALERIGAEHRDGEDVVDRGPRRCDQRVHLSSTGLLAEHGLAAARRQRFHHRGNTPPHHHRERHPPPRRRPGTAPPGQAG